MRDKWGLFIISHMPKPLYRKETPTFMWGLKNMEPPSLRIDLRIDRREPQIIPIKGNNYSHLGNKICIIDCPVLETEWYVWKIIVIVSDVQNSVWNPGHVYARGVETCPKSEARFSEVGIICLESGARLCTVGGNMPQIRGTFFRGRNDFPQIRGR